MVDEALGGRGRADALVDDRDNLQTRSRSTNASTRSPILTCVEALAVPRFTRTFPPRQAVVAADRVLNNRTAQSQASTRVLSTTQSCHGDGRPSTARLQRP